MRRAKVTKIEKDTAVVVIEGLGIERRIKLFKHLSIKPGDRVMLITSADCMECAILGVLEE